MHLDTHIPKRDGQAISSVVALDTCLARRVTSNPGDLAPSGFLRGRHGEWKQSVIDGRNRPTRGSAGSRRNRVYILGAHLALFSVFCWTTVHKSSKGGATRNYSFPWFRSLPRQSHRPEVDISREHLGPQQNVNMAFYWIDHQSYRMQTSFAVESTGLVKQGPHMGSESAPHGSGRKKGQHPCRQCGFRSAASSDFCTPFPSSR